MHPAIRGHLELPYPYGLRLGCDELLCWVVVHAFELSPEEINSTQKAGHAVAALSLLRNGPKV